MQSPQPPADTLPGFDWSGTVGRPPQAPASRTNGGWVRTSAKQEVCATTGRPTGFRHTLMLGTEEIHTGVGADAARTFAAQVRFFNSRVGGTVPRTNGATSAAVPKSSPQPQHYQNEIHIT